MAAPQPLFTLPNADSSEVPHNVWHLDVPRLPDCGIPGVQIFTFLEKVAPTGGGTLIVAGSHRLLNDGERINSKTRPVGQGSMTDRLSAREAWHLIVDDAVTQHRPVSIVPV